MAKNTGLSIPAASIVMITTMMGTGVILLSSSVSCLGYLGGTFGIAFIGSICFFTLYAICYGANKIKGKEISYYNSCASLSPYLGYFADFCIAMQGFGVCIGYLLTIKNWVYKIVPSISGIPEQVTVLAVSIPLIILSLKKDLKSLRYVSYLSVGSVAYLALLLIFFYFKTFGKCPKGEIKAFNTDFASGFPNVIFALGCHQNIVKTFSELSNRTIGSITLVSLIAVGFGSLICISIGVFGYLLFGGVIKETILDLLLNKNDAVVQCIGIGDYDLGRLMTLAGVVGFLIVMTCAFPMQMQPTRDSTINILRGFLKLSGTNDTSLKLGRIITLVYCVLIVFLAMIPGLNISVVAGFLGATVSNFICYGFPCIVYIMAVRKMNPLTILAFLILVGSLISSVWMLKSWASNLII
ncbi:Vacuolar amino acid transporter 5 [Astathelohania contejeani]|uniref:Vacuolar amino acid transporter 5 n=1 Tax=Astathelohania contejeani TaxID=164912 RepID=A0ABQ7HWH9_9MICR|nr:Vacuolar amino acid transporter 5 [Thelohania contejeani]